MSNNHFMRVDDELLELCNRVKEEFNNSNPKLKSFRFSKKFYVKRAMQYYLGESEKL